MSIWGSPSSCVGAGMFSMIASSTAVMSSVRTFQSLLIQFSFALPYTVGKSSWSSVALRLNIRSNTISFTSSGRQLGLSTLLITTTGFSPIWMAF